ncbi:hypothetical protein [Streptomyces sp. NPDC058092]|uniref:hypothetical protein n=1 Tax=Streptomyces sp. NPDC058092 TaxID=3346336 RepID=UPI0036E39F06
MTMTQRGRKQSPSDESVTTPGQRPVGVRILDLVALLALVALVAVVFLVGGPDGMVVISVGAGLYATWKSGQPGRPSGPSDGT